MEGGNSPGKTGAGGGLGLYLKSEVVFCPACAFSPFLSPLCRSTRFSFQWQPASHYVGFVFLKKLDRNLDVLSDEVLRKVNKCVEVNPCISVV